MKEANRTMTPAPCGVPPTRTLIRAKPKFDAIRAALYAHARPEGISCKELAVLVHLNQGYVCSVMRQLELAGEARIASYGISPPGPSSRGGAACALWAPASVAQAES